MGTAALLIVVVGGLWALRIYNRLVRARNQVREGWSGIDVQLKRRHDLVPALVECVKGYQTHERELLEAVSALRACTGCGAEVVGEIRRCLGARWSGRSGQLPAKLLFRGTSQFHRSHECGRYWWCTEFLFNKRVHLSLLFLGERWWGLVRPWWRRRWWRWLVAVKLRV